MPTVDEILGPAPAAPAAAPAAQQRVGGVTIDEFLGPAPKQPQVDPRKIDDILGPPPLDELERRLADLEYKPTDYEIGRLLDLRKEQPLLDRAARFAGNVAEGVTGLATDIGTAVKRTAEKVATDPKVAGQSIAEGFAQGTKRVGEDLVPVLDPPPEASGWTTNPDGTRRRMTEGERKDWTINEFRRKRELEKERNALAKGEKTVLPEILAKPDPDIVRGFSMVDPTWLLIGPAGAEAKAASLLRRAAGQALVKGGRAAEAVGDLGAAVLRAPLAASEKVAEAIVGKGPETAATAQKVRQAATTVAGVSGLGGAGLAHAMGVSYPAIAGTLGAAAAAVPVARVGGQVAQVVGRNIMRPSFSEQLGLLRNIARDPAAAPWMRSAARFASPLDPFLTAAGRTVEGGLHGAAAAGVISGALGADEDQIGQSIGGGLLLGAGARLAAGAGKAAAEARVRADLENWKGTLTPQTAAVLESVLPDTRQQARVMNAQKFISGLGDVDFRYLTDAEWKAAGLPDGRAMETTQGERPTVNVNVNRIGNGSPVLHEAGHVLRRLLPDQFRDLDRTLFSDFNVADGTGTDFSTGRTDTAKGILSPEQQQKLYDQYFSKLPKELQEQRRATWTRREHLQSLREEVTSELLSNLLQDKKPNFLLNLGGVRGRILDSLLVNQGRSLLSRIAVPGLERIRQSTGKTGSTLFTLDGKPLKVSGQAAAALRQILRVRDRMTERLTAGQSGEMAGATGVVGVHEMRGPERDILAKLYGNSDTYAKDAAGNISLDPDGAPILLTEDAVRKLQQQRKAELDAKLLTAPTGPADTLVAGGRELNPVRLAANGENWEGDYFTDAQLAAMRKIPGNILTPAHLENIQMLNDAIKTGQGIRKGLDYNPATREKGRSGRRGYASMGSKFYESVPTGFFINKEGGLSFRLLDIGNVVSKLDRWMKDPKNARHFGIWNNDPRAVMADVYKYVDNQANGRPNSLHLDSDPVAAVQKRNLISDLLGGQSVREGLLPTQLSTKSGRDNSLKTFRIDRVNRLSESAGQNLPFDYTKVKENLYPGGNPLAPQATAAQLPTGISPSAVITHVEASAVDNLRRKLITGGAPGPMAGDLAQAALKEAGKLARRTAAPNERTQALKAARLMDSLNLDGIRNATLKGGTEGAKKELAQQLFSQSLNR